MDNKTVLDLEDDAAYVNWGSSWRMPTTEEQQELLAYTASEWTTLNGVYGRKFTSKTNGNSVFLPAAGYRNASVLDGRGSYGDYWSASLNGADPNDARSLGFYSGYASWYYSGRNYGFTVRPVLRN